MVANLLNQSRRVVISTNKYRLLKNINNNNNNNKTNNIFLRNNTFLQVPSSTTSINWIRNPISVSKRFESSRYFLSLSISLSLFLLFYYFLSLPYYLFVIYLFFCYLLFCSLHFYPLFILILL